MNKTIKSGVREMLFRMISKFEERQQEKDAEFKQKQDCLRVVLNFLENLEDVAGVDEIVKTIEKLNDLEQKDRIRTRNKYKERDRITENNLESFIINVGNSDSSDSNESFHMEVLDSDFDYDSE